MGHYDNCRPGNCVICGQAGGYCEHTERDGRLINPDPDAREDERERGFVRRAAAAVLKRVKW